jgi:hypothetical protein
MVKNQNGSKSAKHMPFWPMFVIVIVALVAGGIIVFSAYDNMTQDDINSATFSSQLHNSAGQNSGF